MASNSEETPRRSRQYRQYLRNACAPIPRTTLWRRSHNAGSSHELASLRAKRSEKSSPLLSQGPSTGSSPSDHVPFTEHPSPKSSSATSSASPTLSPRSCSPVSSPRSCSPVSSPRSCSPISSPRSCSPVSSPRSCSPVSSRRSCSPVSSLRCLSPILSPNNSPENSPRSLSPITSLGDPSPNISPRSPSPPVNTDHPPPSTASAEDIPTDASNFTPNASGSENILSNSKYFTPLYPGAEITLCGALCAIMQFCSQNRLTYTAIGELLQLLHIICPPSQLPKTFYHFKKFFKEFSQDHILKKICLKCNQDDCSCSQVPSHNAAHLVNLEIDKPLETIISRNWEGLHSPMRLQSKDKLEDVWDGSVLRPLCRPGRYFSNEHNLALTLSTDGVPLYKSSPVSIWPVYLVILNLPAHVRMNAENILLCGVWVGPTKPLMNLLLDPVRSYLQRLSTIGIPIKTSFGEFIFRGRLVMGVFDLPAKAPVLCAKQYNGEYGCSVCLHPGKRLPNNARVYLPDTKYDERTHDQYLEYGRKAEETNTCVQGILGLSPFSSILDMVASFPIDYMHNVLEGVTKWLMRTWFDSKFHDQPFYIGRSTRNIDEKLMKQCPPSEFSRPPRSIKKHLKYWKASEFRSWLLFYSLPLLLNVLPSLYWHHYALLVCAMHILLSDSISHLQVDAAEHMLNEFCKLLPELYGEGSCTANAHLLSHLAKYVRLWGPLWTHSAFGFENKNGQIKHFFHGKSDILHQLLFNIDVSHTLQFIHIQLIEHESEQTLQYLHHIKHLAPRHRMNCVGTRSYIVGKYHLAVPTEEQSSALNYSGNIEVFARLLKNNVLYHSTSYERSSSSKRCNIYCCFQDSGGILCFGRIELYVKAPHICVLVRQIQHTGTTLFSKAGHPCRPSLNVYANADLLSSYIVPVNLSSNLCPLSVIEIADIVSKVVLVSVHDEHYFIIQPNSIERH